MKVGSVETEDEFDENYHQLEQTAQAEDQGLLPPGPETGGAAETGAEPGGDGWSSIEPYEGNPGS